MKLNKLFFSISLFFSLIFFSTLVSADVEEKYYTVLLEEPTNLKDALDLVSKNGAEVTYIVEEVGLLQVKANEETMKHIGYNPIISSYNYSLRTISPQENLTSTKLQSSSQIMLHDAQWDMKKITNNGESYKIFSGTKNVTVGIIDSGLDINHPDLKENIVDGSKNFVPKNGFRGEEPEEHGDINYIDDILGHGTYTAGQIAANGNLKGVAPGIGIKSYRVFGSQLGESIWIIKAIIEAAKDDVDVINLSLGKYLVNGTIISKNGQSTTDVPEIKAYKKAIDFARNQGSVVVAAAGNDSLNVNNQDEMYKFLRGKLDDEKLIFKGEIKDIPGSFSNVVTVSSVGPSEELSSFSNYGKNFVDIAAPGGDLRMLGKYGFDEWKNNKLFQKEQIVSTAPNGGYIYDCGNSVAAPKVSGTLALIIDKNHFKDQPNKSVQFLYKYGTNNHQNKKIYFGHGILDVYNAVLK